NAVVVFRRRDQQGIGRPDRLFEDRHGVRFPLGLDITVVERDSGQVENLDRHVWGRQFLRRADEGAIKRFLTKAPGKPEDAKIPSCCHGECPHFGRRAYTAPKRAGTARITSWNLGEKSPAAPTGARAK